MSLRPDLLLVPWPAHLELTSGSVEPRALLAIQPAGESPDAVAEVAQVFAADLQENDFAGRVTPVPLESETVIRLSIVPDKSLGDEGYRLTVDDGFDISAATVRGLFWGTRTALQLLRDGPGAPVPNMIIADKPEFEYRGLMVDPARQLYTIEFHRRMIKNLARYKLNVYHIHFSDDPSYTLPSNAYPNLPTPDRHYTRRQLVDLANLAARYRVTIVPEVEMPGHNGYIGRRLGDVICSGKTWSGVTCAGSDKSYAALETLICEAMEIFPGPYFHIGADEVNYSAWDECPDCQALIAKEGLGDNEGLYNYFINRMNRFVRSKGRRTMIWEGFKVGKTPIVDKDVLIGQFENDYAQPDELVEAGYDLVNASWTPLYLDRSVGSPPQDIAEWNALYFGKAHPPKPLSELRKIEPTEHLKGVCMCPWLIPEVVVEGQLFGGGRRFDGFVAPGPRLPIVAERGWTGARTSAEDVLGRVRCLVENRK